MARLRALNVRRNFLVELPKGIYLVDMIYPALLLLSLGIIVYL